LKVVETIDIWRTANMLIQHHGEGAEREAARLGDMAIEKGDPKAERIWVEVLKAVKSLIDIKPPDR
jgi:hypothetical protein